MSHSLFLHTFYFSFLIHSHTPFLFFLSNSSSYPHAFLSIQLSLTNFLQLSSHIYLSNCDFIVIEGPSTSERLLAISLFIFVNESRTLPSLLICPPLLSWAKTHNQLFELLVAFRGLSKMGIRKLCLTLLTKSISMKIVVNKDNQEYIIKTRINIKWKI